MPPKKRNSQLKEARLAKKSKNNLFIQNTLSHVNDFLTEIDGRLKFEGEEACITMKPGANREGWWTSEHLVKQVNQSKRFDFYFYFKKLITN
jgi:hypothetical protein